MNKKILYGLIAGMILCGLAGPAMATDPFSVDIYMIDPTIGVTDIDNGGPTAASGESIFYIDTSPSGSGVSVFDNMKRQQGNFSAQIKETGVSLYGTVGDEGDNGSTGITVFYQVSNVNDAPHWASAQKYYLFGGTLLSGTTVPPVPFTPPFADLMRFGVEWESGDTLWNKFHLRVVGN